MSPEVKVGSENNEVGLSRKDFLGVVRHINIDIYRLRDLDFDPFKSSRKNIKLSSFSSQHSFCLPIYVFFIIISSFEKNWFFNNSITLQNVPYVKHQFIYDNNQFQAKNIAGYNEIDRMAVQSYPLTD